MFALSACCDVPYVSVGLLYCLLTARVSVFRFIFSCWLLFSACCFVLVCNARAWLRRVIPYSFYGLYHGLVARCSTPIRSIIASVYTPFSFAQSLHILGRRLWAVTLHFTHKKYARRTMCTASSTGFHVPWYLSIAEDEGGDTAVACDWLVVFEWALGGQC